MICGNPCRPIAEFTFSEFRGGGMYWRGVAGGNFLEGAEMVDDFSDTSEIMLIAHMDIASVNI